MHLGAAQLQNVAILQGDSLLAQLLAIEQGSAVDRRDHVAMQTPRDGGDGRTLETSSGADSLLGRPLTDVEKYYIQQALQLTGGKREEAAMMLGIGERTLYRKIKEYDLKS